MMHFCYNASGKLIQTKIIVVYGIAKVLKVLMYLVGEMNLPTWNQLCTVCLS